jgi:hypothetical protein
MDQGGLMKKSLRFTTKALLSGFLTVLPIYLAVLLLLKAIQSIAKLVHPVSLLVPDWLPAESTLAGGLSLPRSFSPLLQRPAARPRS